MSNELNRVSAAEAHALLGQGYCYLDVRTVEEYAAGHPVGAFNIPVMHRGQSGMTENSEFLQVVEATFAKETKLVIGCKAGGRSLKAAAILQAAGYTEVIDMRPGWSGKRDPFGSLVEAGWQAAELPAELVTDGRDYASLRRSQVNASPGG